MLAGAGLAAGRGPTVPRLMGVDTDAALLVTEMYAAPTTTTLIERGESERAGRLAAQWLRAAARPGVTLDDPYNPRHALEDVHRYVRTIASAAGELAGRAVTTASSPPSRGPSSPNGSSIGTRQGATSTTRWRRAGAPCQVPEG